jgi:hypothetical protein
MGLELIRGKNISIKKRKMENPSFSYGIKGY